MSSINQNDQLKNHRLDKLLSLAGIDAMVCMLPENVVYMTGTYPVHGVSIAVYITGCGQLFIAAGVRTILGGRKHYPGNTLRLGALAG